MINDQSIPFKFSSTRGCELEETFGFSEMHRTSENFSSAAPPAYRRSTPPPSTGLSASPSPPSSTPPLSILS